MSRAKSELKTPDRILEATVASLSRHGIDKVSIQMIADRVGVSQTAVLHHFKSKDALVEAAVLRGVYHCREMLSARLEPDSDAYERLLNYGVVNIAWAMKFREEAQLVIMLYYLAVVEDRFAKLYSAIRAGAQERLLDFLHAGRREGLFTFKDEERVHEILHEALMGSIVNALSCTRGSGIEAQLKRKWAMTVKLCTRHDGRAS